MYEDAIMTVIHHKGGEPDYVFSKWRVIGDAALNSEAFPDIWQKFQENGTVKFLAADDEELAGLKVICEKERIRLGQEENVELTDRQKQYVTMSATGSRDVENVINRGERIDSAETVEDLKEEILTSRIEVKA